MQPDETLLLTRSDVSNLLGMEECMTAVENAFRLHATGIAMTPKVLGIHATDGGFHIKAGLLSLGKNYFVAKINSNFSANTENYGLPAIQGIITVYDGSNGQLLALMDSIEVTIIRTGATTGVAAKYLAKADSRTATICGCGNQGRASLKAIMKVRPLEKVYTYDVIKEQAETLANDFKEKSATTVIATNELRQAVQQSDICVTCTPSIKPFLGTEDVADGIFIAAVGADSEQKQELFPELLTSSKLVVDLMDQCATMGELHHALDAKLITLDGVHAELGEVITGKKAGRTSDKETIIFDSTGTALQDAAAAAIVYERAVSRGAGVKLNFAERQKSKKELEMIARNKRDIDALSGFFPFR